jgi:hypothetical protein
MATIAVILTVLAVTVFASAILISVILFSVIALVSIRPAYPRIGRLRG